MDDFLERVPTDKHKCIDCAKCVSPDKHGSNQHIRFRYPKNVKSGYASFFKDKKAVKTSSNFDYDKIRLKIKQNYLSNKQPKFVGAGHYSE